jgi:hypothetical protein
MIANHNNICLVGLPDYSESAMIYSGRLCYMRLGKRESSKLPEGDYELIGIYPRMSEKQAARVVEVHSITRLRQHGYKDYRKSRDRAEFFTCITALESLSTLIESVGMYTVNPYGRNKTVVTIKAHNDPFSVREAQNKWQDAEERTFEKIAILRRTDGGK